MREGWLIDARRGNQPVFKINDSHPLFNEIKALIRKITGGEAVLRKIAEDNKDITIALIYGSYAKDRLRAEISTSICCCVGNPSGRRRSLA